MKKAFVNLFVILILAFALFISCKKEDIKENKHPEELIGAWDMRLNIPECLIGTNSFQETWDFSAAGNGGITISGDVQSELKYIGSNGELVVLLNFTPFEFVRENVFPAYVVAILSNTMMMFNIYNSEEEELSYMVMTSEPFFDYESFTASFTELEIGIQEGDSVILDGSLIARKLEIPPITPTFVTILDMPELGDHSYFFNEDGSFDKTMFYEDDSLSSGKWEVDNDMLYIIDTTTNEFPAEADTLVFSYFVLEETMTLFPEEKQFCNSESEIENCLLEFEYRLFLDSASLIDVSYYARNMYARPETFYGTKSVRTDNYQNKFMKRIMDVNYYKSKLDNYFKK